MAASSKRFNRSKTSLLAVLAFAVAALFAVTPASAAIDLEEFAFETADAGGLGTQQASGHPDQSVTSFAVAKGPDLVPVESPRNFVVDLPPGLVGSPAAVPTCTDPQLAAQKCPLESQVGLVELGVLGFKPLLPLYNMKAPPGVLAQFGFWATTVSVHLVATVRSEPEYGVTVSVRNTPQALPFHAVKSVFWGVPAAASHDEWRRGVDEIGEVCVGGGFFDGSPGTGCPVDPAQARPFLTNPSACSPTSIAVGHVDSWDTPGVFDSASAGNVNGADEPIGITGCDAVDFSPSFEAQPTSGSADTPTGLSLHVHLPQNDDPDGLAEAQLKDASFEFPPGMTVNASSAAGLEGCSRAQIGLTTAVGQPAHFNTALASCPDASRLGKVQLVTPLLSNPLQGTMYLASPHDNPFGSLLALYLAVEDPERGVVIKLAGKVTPDPETGQLTVAFPQNPQLPFEDLTVSLFPGSRAALKTPLACGRFTTNGEMVPWTAPEGPTRNPSASFEIGSGANGASCPASEAAAPHQPSFIAGTAKPTAGTYSPFVLRVSRNDGSQPIKGIDATLPKGLLGRLAGIPYCSESALAAARAKSGRDEQSSSSCPAASQIGRVAVGVGAGSTPVYVTGKAYLAGPYKEAPLSLAIVTPAVVGPFDLGTVVVRNALEVDPVTTRIHVVSDPLPQILQGIPIAYRDIRVEVDRPRFTINPTTCKAMEVTSVLTSATGQAATPSSLFQASGCRELGFKPSLKLSLKGKMNRTGNPAVKAVLKAPKGQANIAKTTVALPKSEFIDNAHISNPCTRVQFNADQCPAGSILGHATAYTPLLDKPLSGPVYFRSNGGDRELPDLVADLKGQIHVTLVGFIDTAKSGGVRTRFANVPDAPVSKFVLSLKGGRKGLIENSENLCSFTPKAKVQMTGQNGKTANSSVKLGTSCAKK